MLGPECGSCQRLDSKMVKRATAQLLALHGWISYVATASNKLLDELPASAKHAQLPKLGIASLCCGHVFQALVAHSAHNQQGAR